MSSYQNETTSVDGSASVNPPEQWSVLTSEAGTQTDLIVTKTMSDSSTQTDPVVVSLIPSRSEMVDLNIQVDENSQPETVECVSLNPSALVYKPTK